MESPLTRFFHEACNPIFGVGHLFVYQGQLAMIHDVGEYEFDGKWWQVGKLLVISDFENEDVIFLECYWHAEHKLVKLGFPEGIGQSAPIHFTGYVYNSLYRAMDDLDQSNGILIRAIKWVQYESNLSWLRH